MNTIRSFNLGLGTANSMQVDSHHNSLKVCSHLLAFHPHCSAWRAGIRRVWGLPRTAHNNLLPLISCQPPLSDVIAKRFISYVQRCLTSDCGIVNCVVQYGIWFGRMASPVGCSVQHCCNKYGFTADDIACVSTKIIDKYFIQNVGHGTVDSAHAARANFQRPCPLWKLSPSHPILV